MLRLIQYCFCIQHIFYLQSLALSVWYMYTGIDKIGSHKQNQYLQCLELI